MGCNCGSSRTVERRPTAWKVRTPDGQEKTYLSNTEAYAAAGGYYNAAGRQTPADAVWPEYAAT